LHFDVRVEQYPRRTGLFGAGAWLARALTEVLVMNKSLSFSCVALAVVALFASGCSGADGSDEPSSVDVEAESAIHPLAAPPRTEGASIATLVAALGSGQGVSAAATSPYGDPVTAIRWPSSALKGSFAVAAGQPCSRVAAPAGTSLTMAVVISGSYASCR
jgi:hypothetical protein